MPYAQIELKTMAVCSGIGACVSYLVGGFDAPLKALLVLIAVDYITGIIAAWRTGTLSSSKGFKGLGKKAAVLGIVAFANVLDVSMSLNHLLRGMAVFGFAGMEGLSIIENIDRMGYGEYIPDFIRQKLIQLRDEKGVITNGTSQSGNHSDAG